MIHCISCEYCRCYSSKQFQHKLNRQWWSPVFNVFHSINARQSQTLNYIMSMESIVLSLHRPSFDNQAFQVPPAILAYNSYRPRLNNTSRLYSKARGDGCTSSKKTCPTTTSYRRPCAYYMIHPFFSNRRRTDVVADVLARRRDNVAGSSRFTSSRRRRMTSSGPVHDDVVTSSRSRIFWRVTHLA